MDDFYKLLNDSIGSKKSTIYRYLSGDYYNNFILQKEYFPYQFDSWTENKNFGLIDKKGRSIFPRDEYLKPYTNVLGQTHKNLSFVVDAFLDLKKYHTSLTIGNKFDKSSFSMYVKPEVEISTENVDQLYINYINLVYEGFKAFLDSNLLSGNNGLKSITNIDAFFKSLSLYFKSLLKYGIINRSTFITSKYGNPNVSGIFISLANKELYTNYDDKINSYINDPNFTIFLDSAKRYGFYVDKNAPWRIVADLGSQVMLTYADKYGLKSTDDIHNKCYHVAYKSDLTFLRNIIIGLWNTVARDYKLIVNSKDLNNCAGYFTEVGTRQQVTTDMFDKYFNEDFLLRMYFYIKTYEQNLQVDQKRFDYIVAESTKINKYIGKDAALDYLYSKVEEYMPYKPSTNKDLTNPDVAVKINEQMRDKPTFLPEISF